MSTAVRVILVEDSPPFRKGLAKILSADPRVELLGSAANGEDGLALARQTEPEVVLLDLELPDLSGIEVTRRLKRVGGPEVLILTAFESEERVFEAMQAGASGYLLKRSAAEKLVESLLEIREGGTLIEPRLAKRFWHFLSSVQGGGQTPALALSQQERDVLKWLAKGLTNADIGKVMAIERRSVRTQLDHLYAKLEVHSRVDAVVKALKLGLIELDA